MGQLGNQPENAVSKDLSTAENVLKSVTQDLKSLQQNVLVQLTQDVARLQYEKSQLIVEIEQLRTQHRILQSQHIESLSQQQVAQQQLWAKQLAQVLASHLQTLLTQRLDQLAVTPTQSSGGLSHDASANHHYEHAYQLLTSLDGTLSTTFKSLQQDLSSYHSSLSQQLNRMHSMEQQGEAILEALVSRLREQLQTEATRLQVSTPPVEENGYAASFSSYDAYQPSRPTRVEDKPTSVAVPVTPEPEAFVTPLQPVGRKRLSQVQVGLLLVLCSSMALSFYNVVIKVILKRQAIFGVFELGGLIAPSLGSSLLILALRMLVVVPLMALLAGVLHPPVWQDIEKFLRSQDSRLRMSVIGSGFFLFLSQVLIYIALGQISAGIAITIFFIYPIVTVFLAWKLFGDRPTVFRLLVMATICVGGVLALPTSGGPAGNIWLGAGTAAGSGVAFAAYVVLTQVCAQKLHPVPFSLINFITILIFSLSSLLIPLPAGLAAKVDPTVWPALLVGGLVLGATTLVGYLLNNFGIRFIGAAKASIIGASGPAITAILAFLIIQETLQPKQMLGMLLVTLGVGALSFERLQKQMRAAKAKKA